MQAQRSVRVSGLFRAARSKIHAPQGLVPHLQRSARIREPLPGSGIDENIAVWRPSQRTLTLKGFNSGRLQIHISNFVGICPFVASLHTGRINADLSRRAKILRQRTGLCQNSNRMNHINMTHVAPEAAGQAVASKG